MSQLRVGVYTVTDENSDVRLRVMVCPIFFSSIESHIKWFLPLQFLDIFKFIRQTVDIQICSNAVFMVDGSRLMFNFRTGDPKFKNSGNSPLQTYRTKFFGRDKEKERKRNRVLSVTDDDIFIRSFIWGRLYHHWIAIRYIGELLCWVCYP